MDVDDRPKWQKLQQVGLNAYEARSYLVLMGHSRFKALELAGRAHVPRQKVYEVLDSLVDKGFAQVVQEKTKLFSAIDPSLAIPSFLARRSQIVQRQLVEQEQLADGLIHDLNTIYQDGHRGNAALDSICLVNDPMQTAVHHRRMLEGVTQDYVELCAHPLETNLFNEHLLSAMAARGVACRLIMDAELFNKEHAERLEECRNCGVLVRFLDKLPLQLVLFDRRRGLLALLDPVRSASLWTSVIFEHAGFAEAMSCLFESYWCQSRPEL